MAHDHNHHHHHHHAHSHGHHDPAHNHSSIQNIKFAFLVNFAFALVQIAGGLWSQSSAVLAGAMHDLSDSLTLIVAYIMERTAHRQSTPHFSYGFKRLSLASAFITCVIVALASFGIIWQAIPRLANPGEPKISGMLGFAMLGILVNGVAAVRLYRGRTLNERVASWHLVEDLLGWAAVLIGSILIKLTGLTIIDPILSIALAVFVLYGVSKSVIHVTKLFLQATPNSLDIPKLKRDILAVQGVQSLHDMHLWSLDGNAHVLTLHIVVSETSSSSERDVVKDLVRKKIQENGQFHATIEVETTKTPCPDLHCVSEG